MKQSGFRLVQRKFAQGVPIPASSSPAAPTPPEKKSEPPCPPRSVYHNNMSARSLLDIVALQNLHRHKQQPLVLLKRLREDEIPSAFSSAVKKGPKKRRGVNGDKNKMALRSGKRKSPDAPKSALKRRKKSCSESTDDVPLAFYDLKKRREAQANKDRLLRRHTRSQADEKQTENGPRLPVPKRMQRLETPDYSDESSFTFKEPKNPVRLSYRRFREQRAAAAKRKPHIGRQLRKLGRPTTEPRSSPRSSRSSSVECDILKRLRNKLVLAGRSQSSASRESTETPTRDIPSPAPSSCLSVGTEAPMFSLPSPPPSVASSAPGPNYVAANRSQPLSLSAYFDERYTSFMADDLTKCRDGLKTETARGDDNRSRDWCIQDDTRAKSETSSVDNMSMIKITDVVSKSSSTRKSQEETAGNEPQSSKVQTDLVTTQVKEPSASAEQFASDSDLVTLNVLKQKMMETRNGDKGQQHIVKNGEPECNETTAVEKRGNKKKILKQKKLPKKRNVRQAAAKTATPKAKKIIITRGSKARRLPTRLAKSTTESAQTPGPVDADVYEFDAEREASGPPSGLRTRRSQPSASSEASQPAQPADKTKKTMSEEKKKELLEKMSGSPLLLDKFLDFISPETQTRFDHFMAAEQASDEYRSSIGEGKSDAAYLDPKPGVMMEALTFHPTAEEFADPIKYFEKIAQQASKHGLCKIVPPADFKPPCNITDSIRFAVIYQYIFKMYNRWGPVTRELAAIKAHLRTQSVVFTRSPLLDGSELNLTKLYHVVERHGGLNNVMQRKRWGRVAEELKLGKMQHPARKLDPLYMRFLLPYATLSDSERQAIMTEVEKYWTLKYQKMLNRARNPFQRQARMLSAEVEYETSSDEDDEMSTAGALREAEDCTVPGRTMNLATFKKVASALMDTHFEPSKQPPSPVEVEKAYWKAVLLGTEHIVANTASIDTGEEGYGFPKDPEAPYGNDPWNLKVLARNPSNVLRYLGQVLGVTVPTLHVNMVFSTSCWHRDPHGLPWIEYMHKGAEKIWYGIPKDESANFRRAVETLCPAYCQNKAIWLASEITMIPPNILSEHQVRLSRLVQRPGEYVMVFPEAHTCSITTGFGISESVYFASKSWLADVYKLFQELRNSCEPTMFSLEQLLLNGSRDDDAPQQVCVVLCTLLNAELEHRRALEGKGLEVDERIQSDAPLNTSYFRPGHARDHDDECEYCRCTLYLSKVTGLTGRNSAVCPEHALRLLETKKHRHVDMGTLEFLSSYSTRAIEDMVEAMEARLEVISGTDARAQREPQPGTSGEVYDLTTPSPEPADVPEPSEDPAPQPSTSRQVRQAN